MTHTPGPWTVSQLHPDGRLIIDKAYYEIDTPDYTVVAWMPHAAPIRKFDDARLIAAAPQLLKACKAARVGIGFALNDASEERMLSVIGRLEDIHSFITESIAAAEGGEK